MKSRIESEAMTIRKPLVALIASAFLAAPLVGCNENVETESDGTTVERNPVETLNSDLISEVVIGGRLYDNWIAETGLTTPTTANPLGNFADSAFETDIEKTYRCKTCHGFTYEGEYGFAGLLDAADSMSVEDIESIISNGFSFKLGTTSYVVHDYASSTYGLEAADITALAKFIKYGVVDTSNYLYSFGVAKGDAANGKTLYDGAAGCSGGACHGANGNARDFDDGDLTTIPNEFVGTIGQEDPWEMLHKIRFGHPGETSMPAIYDEPSFTTQDAVDIMTYTQELPAS